MLSGRRRRATRSPKATKIKTKAETGGVMARAMSHKIQSRRIDDTNTMTPPKSQTKTKLQTNQTNKSKTATKSKKKKSKHKQKSKSKAKNSSKRKSKHKNKNKTKGETTKCVIICDSLEYIKELCKFDYNVITQEADEKSQFSKSLLHCVCGARLALLICAVVCIKVV